MPVFSQIRAISLRDQVAEQIRIAIIEGRLKPGDHIVEATLTEQFGVSRTPVREALIILERESLVISIPNYGCYVRAFTADDIRALFSMRVALENFAAELIVDKLDANDHAHLNDLIERQRRLIEQNNFREVRSTDMEFHRYLVTRSEHPHLMRNWQEIVAQIAAVLYLRAEGIGDYDEYLAIEDHRRILDAYIARNLAQIAHENRRINKRVEDECVLALGRIQAGSS
ncbi:MAG: GntR family transcriptional regulator [Chloroflexi bacterium]|nr:GntR family transcriptional regulator [Chloroflexota bacterium]